VNAERKSAPIHAHLRVIALSFEMGLRQNFSDAFILFSILVQPLLLALLAFWMLRDQGNENIIFIVVGSGMTGLWTAVLFISGSSITSERWSGTLEMITAVPAPIQTIIMGKNLANVSQSLLSMVVSYTLASLVFGNLPRLEKPGLFVLALVFAAISYVSFGLVLAPLFVINPNVSRLVNGLEFPVYILSGFLFPIALLPGWTTPLSYLLAPYWAARALHGASSGGSTADILFSCAMMILFIIVYSFITQALFRRLLFKARVEATMGRQ
jgi:ABC-2 type transport system permease protein